MSKPYFVVDAHEDLAYNVFSLGRDPRLSAKQTRANEPQLTSNGTATVGLDDFLEGNVRLVFATIYVSPSGGSNTPGKTYKTADEANALGQEQLAYYALLAADPRVMLVTSRDDLKQVVNGSDQKIGLVLLMEGADPIVTPTDAAMWYEGGVRIIGPAWSQTRYSGGTNKPGPLTEIGKQLMREMSKTGFILDTSHMAEESFFRHSICLRVPSLPAIPTRGNLCRPTAS